MDVSKGGVNGGGGGEGSTERFGEGVVGGGNGLDFASGTFVENVTVPGFIVPVANDGVSVTSWSELGRMGWKTHSGSSRVNM